MSYNYKCWDDNLKILGVEGVGGHTSSHITLPPQIVLVEIYHSPSISVG